MGQKVHPYGFRLGYNKDWHSHWFTKKQYGDFLHEDLRLKKEIKGRFAGAGVSHVDIERAEKGGEDANGRGRKSSKAGKPQTAGKSGKGAKATAAAGEKTATKRAASKKVEQPEETKAAAAEESAAAETSAAEKSAE